jgi:hypothetical protein
MLGKCMLLGVNCSFAYTCNSVVCHSKLVCPTQPWQVRAADLWESKAAVKYWQEAEGAYGFVTTSPQPDTQAAPVHVTIVTGGLGGCNLMLFLVMVLGRALTGCCPESHN